MAQNAKSWTTPLCLTLAGKAGCFLGTTQVKDRLCSQTGMYALPICSSLT